MNVFIRPDNSYFLTAFAVDNIYYRYGTANLIISSDGQTLLDKHILSNPSVNYATGKEGTAKRQEGGYIMPFGPDQRLGFSGLIKYNNQGDTVFTRTYNDTNVFNEGIVNIAVLHDSTIFAVGERQTSFGPLKDSALIQRIDKNGNLIWARAYNRDTGANNQFTSIEMLPDNRLLVGGYLKKAAKRGQYSFHFYHPWFLILDTVGNILRDTVYSDHYYPGSWVGGGNIYIDINGGYFHWGGKDSTPTPYPSSVSYQGNYPYYLAHLDTNFNITWRISFPTKGNNYTGGYGSIFQVIQTKDGSYLVMGSLDGGTAKGWLTKIDRYGIVRWEHIYIKDSSTNGYLVDAEERPDGGFVAVGWTQVCRTCSQDVWLLSVDSNGCELPGCNIATAVSNLTNIKSDFALYPNPTSGNITVSVSDAGTLNVYTALGTIAATYTLKEGKNNIGLPSNLAAGIYLGRFRTRDGRILYERRIVLIP